MIVALRMDACQRNGVVAFAATQLEGNGIVVAKLLTPFSSQGKALLFQLVEAYLEEVGKCQILGKTLQFMVSHQITTER